MISPFLPMRLTPHIGWCPLKSSQYKTGCGSWLKISYNVFSSINCSAQYMLQIVIGVGRAIIWTAMHSILVTTFGGFHSNSWQTKISTPPPWRFCLSLLSTSYPFNTNDLFWFSQVSWTQIPRWEGVCSSRYLSSSAWWAGRESAFYWVLFIAVVVFVRAFPLRQLCVSCLTLLSFFF